MKYKIKRSLPFAMIGEEIEIILDIGRMEPFLCFYKDRPIQLSGLKQSELDFLIDEGWIEKIEPRQWEVGVWAGHLLSPDSYLKEVLERDGDKIEIIKVREVKE